MAVEEKLWECSWTKCDRATEEVYFCLLYEPRIAKVDMYHFPWILFVEWEIYSFVWLPLESVKLVLITIE